MKKIEIIANKEADTKEISGLEDISDFCNLEDFSINNNGGSRELGASMPPELFIIIKVVGISIAAGFFAAIGADLWKGIKKLVIKSFKYYESPGESYLYNPDIYIEIKEENKSKIQILFPTRNFKKQELEKSLQKLDIFLEKYKSTEPFSIYFSKGRWIISEKQFMNQEEEFKNILINENINKIKKNGINSGDNLQ